MKNLVYSIFVEGEPKAQPRPRKGKYGNFYNPPTVDAWKQAVQTAFLENRKPPIEGPVILSIHFHFHKTRIKKIQPHTAKPDKDNLEKAVMDALTEIGIWKDDCQVYGGCTYKLWTPEKSGARIWVEELVVDT